MRYQPAREFYIPSGALKVADKASDAVAYVYADRDQAPCALVFFGKQSKPIWRYRFRSVADREKRIGEAFASRRARHAAHDQRRAERAAETHKLQVGHILKSSWGYEQTNVDFYQVTAVISAKMVEIRPIASTTGKDMCSMSRSVLPVLNAFTGDPMRKRAGKGGVKIASYAWAFVWDGTPAFESSWH